MSYDYSEKMYGRQGSSVNIAAKKVWPSGN